MKSIIKKSIITNFNKSKTKEKIKETTMKNQLRLILLMVAAMAVILIGTPGKALAIGTDAGVTVSNSASLVYSVASVT